jgi:hypothetical protein
LLGPEQPAGTYARQILSRLLVDLSGRRPQSRIGRTSL